MVRSNSVGPRSVFPLFVRACTLLTLAGFIVSGTNLESRARALRIDRTMDRLRVWRVPVSLAHDAEGRR